MTRYFSLIVIVAVNLCIITLFSGSLVPFDQNLKNQSSAPSPFITFIIPSIGRDSLNQTLNSLNFQTDQSWKAIIIADGYNFSDSLISNWTNWSSGRLTFINHAKLGSENHAGSLRNIGISHATTEWIGFVDDDDCLDIGYVSILRNEVLRFNSDIFIFRMIWPDGRVLPKHRLTHYEKGDVGISFAMKRKIFENGYKFVPDEYEDFNFISRVDHTHEYNVKLTEHILYYVKCLS